MGENTTLLETTRVEIRSRMATKYGEDAATILETPRAWDALALVAWEMGYECGMKQGLTSSPPRETSEDMVAHATRYITTADWPNHYPWPTVGGLRNLIQCADKNGFAAVIKRVGRRVLIDEAAFHRWVASGGEG